MDIYLVVTIVIRSGMKMNNTKKYAVLNSQLKIINLCNHPSHSPMRDVVFDKYSITPNQKIIEGEIKDYVFDMYNETDINDVDPSEIITKKSLFGGIKKTYKTGWILLKKRKHTKIVNPSGFIIYTEED
jgi:hypothetical protein